LLAAHVSSVSECTWQAPTKSRASMAGGAIYVDGWLGNSILTFGGLAIFCNNSGTRGGAVTLGDRYPDWPLAWRRQIR
jgi:hypothetical protein